MAVRSVITGDIVNSTKLSKAMEKKLNNTLLALYTNHQMEFYRGDSFQAYIKDPKRTLQLALLSRVAAIRLFKSEKIVVSDVRISIGIGNVSSPVKTLKTAKGEAFLLSGRQFDHILKNNQRLAITSTNALANIGLQVIADYLNAIFNMMTGKQAEVIFELLNGELQNAVAKKLKKTKSSIHQRITSGRWPEIEKLIQQYEQIINQL